MNRTSELQYIADTLLVEKVLTLDASLRKEAAVGEILTGLENEIKNFIAKNIDPEKPFESVLKNLLAPALLFRANKFLGILYYAAKEAGIDFENIWSSVVGAIRPKLEKGEEVTSEEINAAGKSLLVQASDDLFHELRELEKRGELIKTAQLFGRRYTGRTQPLGGAMFVPPKGSSMLGRIFGFLEQRKVGAGRSLVTGFIVWIIKTILAGAVLAAGAGAIGKAVKKEKAPEMPEFRGVPGTVMVSHPMTGQQAPVNRPPPVAMPAKARHSFQSSGRGEMHHLNDDNNVWIVPIYGNIRNTLASWAQEIYPELAQHMALVQSSPSFNRMANILGAYIDPKQPNYLVMPKGINRRVDVVDTFASDVDRTLQQREQKAST